MTGFYGFVLVFVQLCLAIQSGNYGFGLVSIEESEWTADFLLSKPVSRSAVLTSKLLAAMTSLLITDLVVWSASVLSIWLFREGREVDGQVLSLLFLSLFIFQFFFLAVGLLISLLVRRVRSVTPYSLSLGFGTYVLNAFSGIFSDVKLEYLTPFKHFDPMYIIQERGFDERFLLLNVSVTLVAVAISYVLYLRRDIPAVS